ncbi:MAG: hypothetical protein WDN26_24045 [Chitinophagaceae bacterium]
MLLKYLIKDKNKRKRVAHIGASFIILIHAYENHETSHHSYKLFLVAGIVFLAIALFHPVIEKRFPWVDGVFFLIEGILSLMVALDLFHMGEKSITYNLCTARYFPIFYSISKREKRNDGT